MDFQQAVSNAYLNGDQAFTSSNTVYSAMRQRAITANPSAAVRQDYPSLSQVKDILARIDIASTTKPYKIHNMDYDSIVARNTGSQGSQRRDQVQFDIVDWQRVWRSNRLRPIADTL